MPVKPAFVNALRDDTASLSPVEQRVFTDGCKLTSETIVREVQVLDETHQDRSISRHNFLNLLNHGLSSLLFRFSYPRA